MKKLFILCVLSSLTMSTAMASLPLVPNVGVKGSIGTKESYIEGKVLPHTYIGYKKADRDEYGHQNDFYAKYNVLGSKVQLLGGYRNHMTGQDNSFYGGVGVATPHVLGWQPYANYIKGSHFGETNIGLNYTLALGVGLNVNYHNYMPDKGNNEHGVGAGVTFQF